MKPIQKKGPTVDAVGPLKKQHSNHQFTEMNSCLEPPHHAMGVDRGVEEALVTMTSLEIAHLLEVRHDNVKVTIERLTARGVMTLPALEEVSNAGPGPKTIEVYRVGKRDSYVVVAQISPEFTARVVDRWQELEAQRGVLSRMDILHMAIDSEQRALDAEKLSSERAFLIEQQKPAIAFVEQYVNCTGNKGVRETAKLLRANERQFIAWMIGRDIMYRLAGKLTAHAPHLNAGRFAVQTDKAARNEHVYNECKFTPKGVAWIAGKWAKHQAPGGAT